MRGSVLRAPSLLKQHFPHRELTFQHLCFLIPKSVIAINQYTDQIVGVCLCEDS